MARTSAMKQVLSQMIPVFPSGSQSPYYRSANNVVTDQRLRSINSCVAAELEGTSPGDRSSAREAFGAAASDCHSQY